MEKVQDGIQGIDGSKLVEQIVQEQQRNALTFVFPKQSFQRVIENDAQYVHMLQVKLIALNNRKNELIKIATEMQKRGEKISPKSNLEVADIDVEMWETQSKMRVQEKLVMDKQTHYSQVWLPAYNKELEAAMENWEKCFVDAQQIISVDVETVAENKKTLHIQIKAEIDRYHALAEKHGRDAEIINDVYKSLRRLVLKYNEN